MDPYQFEVTCEACGGAGLGTIKTATAEWVEGSVITHRDPRVCIANLRREREQQHAASSER